MFNFVPVEERELRCYDFFNKHGINDREMLRDKLKTNPIEGVTIKFTEEMFADYQKLKKHQEKRQAELQSTGKNHRTSFILSDVHIPFHDEKTIELVYQCIADNEPDNIVILGDFLDCYSISRFAKKPDKARNLQYEIDVAYKYLRELRKIAQNANIILIKGNHEERLTKLLMDNPGLYGLKSLTYEKLLHLDELNIQFVENEIELDGFIAYHGDCVSKNAGYSAKGEFEGHGMNTGISGHTHRLSSYYLSYAKKVGQWYENGCLCTLDPDYLPNPRKANWQQGFTVFDCQNGLVQGTQVLIQDHQFVYNNVLYK